MFGLRSDLVLDLFPFQLPTPKCFNFITSGDSKQAEILQKILDKPFLLNLNVKHEKNMFSFVHNLHLKRLQKVNITL